MDSSKTREFLQAREDSMRRVQGRLSFDLYNVARDEAAFKFFRPNQAIFYYKAIDEGRVGFEVHIGTRGPNRSPLLHFKISSSEWRVAKRVGPVAPRRITDTAMDRVRAVITAEVTARMIGALDGSRVPTGQDLLIAVGTMQEVVIEIFSLTTVEKTVAYNVKQDWYGVESTPLSEAFVTVPRGAAPRIGGRGRR